MPELPEVETVARGLALAMAGRSFTRIELRRADLRFAFPDGFAARLTGRRVVSLSRRAKYILGELDGPDMLLMHLGMSGRFIVLGAGAGAGEDRPGAFRHAMAAGANSAHVHVVFHLDDGARILFADPRRFGLMDLAPVSAPESHRLLARLGPEPLSDAFSAGHLASAVRGRAVTLKAALLDQRVVAGLGNIYVCEALFRARLSPTRPAASLARASGPGVRAVRLVAEIRATLQDAIAAGGSTLRDFAHADGGLGYFQHRFDVYDREGEPCRRGACAGTVRRIVQSGRSSFYCPTCQR